MSYIKANRPLNELKDTNTPEDTKAQKLILANSNARQLIVENKLDELYEYVRRNFISYTKGLDAVSTILCACGVDILAHLSVIPANCFDGCAWIDTAFIPKNITKIEKYAFSNSSLTKVVFAPDSPIQVIESGAFSAAGLSNITLPALVEEIGHNLLLFNDKLLVVDFSQTMIKEIPDGCFYGCSHLEKVYLPKITRINAEAFRYCKKLREINFAGTQAEWHQVANRGEALPAGHEFPVKVVCTNGITTVI